MDKCIKNHICAVWREAEKSKNLVGRIRVKWPRLTGAIGARLQMRHIPCGVHRHMKPISHEISLHKANSS